MEAPQLVQIMLRYAKRVPAGIPGAQKVYGDHFLFDPNGLESFLMELAESIDRLEEQKDARML